jgi:hypothetical protein
MAKRKRRKRPGRPEIHRRLLSREQTSITGEAAYIIRRAQSCDARVVSLGSLIFFSTATGDAWMLDADDKLAVCLARDGKAQPYRIIETKDESGIEWQATYQIEGDLFIVTERSGRTRVIMGYPAREILRACRQGEQ